MPLKDHYRTLGIAANANLQDVKKAYRVLAHKYHPDKNPDNSLSYHHFREIQEAYDVLSDDSKRRLYDEERYFAGLSAQKKPEHVSAKWILKEAMKLSAHMANVDSYRMNHRALHDYVSLLLSDSHIAVLQQEQEPEMNKKILTEILLSIKNIRFQYFSPLSYRLSLIAGADQELQQIIFIAAKQRKKSASLEKYMPFIIIAITILLCFIMYLYSRKT